MIISTLPTKFEFGENVKLPFAKIEIVPCGVVAVSPAIKTTPLIVNCVTINVSAFKSESLPKTPGTASAKVLFTNIVLLSSMASGAVGG